MHKLFLFASMLILALLVVSPIHVLAQKKQLKLAALLPLSGSGADQGIRCRHGLELALDEVKDEFTVELTFEDTRGDPKLAVDAYRNVQFRNAPHALFSWGSGVGLALTPLVNKDKIVQVGLATGTPKYRTLDDYTFRVFHSNEDEARFVAAAISARWPQGKGAVVRIQNEYGESFFEVLKEKLTSDGVELVYEDSFLPGTVDFRTQLLNLKDKAPQFIILLVYPVEGLALLKQVKEFGISNLPIISGGALFATEVLSNSAVLSQPSLSIVIQKPSGESKATKKREDLAVQHQRLFDAPLEPYDFFTFRAYDAFHTVIDAARRCVTITSDCLKGQLYASGESDAIFYPVKFDRYGDTPAEFVFFLPGAKILSSTP